jgi:hypothetical protein
MLIVETVGRIRREHLVKGKSIKEIARDLSLWAMFGSPKHMTASKMETSDIA